MKKLLLVILLLFTLMACEEAEEQADIAEVAAMEYASEYFSDDFKSYIIDITRVDYVYYEGELQPITKDGLYGTYFFIEYYFDTVHEDYVLTMVVKLWYETEAKETIVNHEVINV